MRSLRCIGGILLLAGTLTIFYDLFICSSPSVSLVGSPATTMYSAWTTLHPRSLEAVRAALDAVVTGPFILSSLKLAASVPVALVLYFFGGAAIIISWRYSHTPIARTSETNITTESAQPASESRALAPIAASRSRIDAKYREFLPAALEIVETPPSPVAVALLWLVCLGFSSLLAWSYFGHLDIYATAQGKVQPTGGSKIVQPLSPGKVIAMHVENGSHVAAGDILIELDPTETTADRKTQAEELQATRAEIARREVAIEIARGVDLSVRPIAFDHDVSDLVRQREEAVLAADIAHLVSTRDSLKAQLEESIARHDRMIMTVSARKDLLTVLKERVDARNALDAQGGGYRSKVIDALQEYERERTNLASDQGQLIEVDAGRRSVEAKIEETIAQFIDEQTSKLAEAQRKRDGLVQDLIKATMKEKQTRLTAPISGVVQQLSVTTVGQVVASGQALMTIVPDNAPVEIEAMILNRDIGFVKVGQPVTIKVDAFPFTRYGTLDGTVSTISHDGVDQKTATNLSDAASLARPQNPPSSTNSATAQTLAFPARITISRQSIKVDGGEVPLRPGMSTTVEVRTGQRRAIDYILSPLREIKAASLQER
jgi:hemolysin D